MDKRVIEKFAVNSRNRLIEEIKLRLAQLGIDDQGADEKEDRSTREAEFYAKQEQPLTGDEISWRRAIVDRLTKAAKSDKWATAYNDLVEEVAYTWFNRIVAIRFMEVNDYLPSHVRVLSSSEGRNEPDIMTEALTLGDDLGGFSVAEKQLYEDAWATQEPAKMDKLYQMLFLKQVDALNQNLPKLFEKTDGYMKLLFTPSYNNGVIKVLVTEIKEDWLLLSKSGQVEVIGWIYQAYNSNQKDVAMAQPKSHKFRSKEIASATQIFTPDWIVKYMVQNSVGKYWVKSIIAKGDGRAEEKIAEDFEWQYYMVDANQTDDVASKLVVLDSNLDSLTPEELKIIDPSMGSGHILVYAFDLLMQIYLSVGYSKRDAAQQIIENNLYGIDIDKRATQLAYFSLMMKFRSVFRRALSGEYQANILTIPSTDGVSNKDIDFQTVGMVDKDINEIRKLIATFRYGNILGSLIDVSDIDEKKIEKLIFKAKELNTFGSNELVAELSDIYHAFQILHLKYDVVVTNPPYMGSARMNSTMSEYTKKIYPRAKSDLFAVFMEHFNKMIVSGGFNAMVTMQSWMFLSSFEQMRTHLLNNYTISNLMHMENNVMGIAFGTAVTVIRNMHIQEFIGTYHQVKTEDVSTSVPTTVPIPGNRFNRTNQTNFEKIPGSPIGYWINNDFATIWRNSPSLGSLLPVKKGSLVSKDNYTLLHYWYEISNKEINWNPTGKVPWIEKPYKFALVNKGGGFRKWAGNQEYVILLTKKYYELIDKHGGHRTPERYYEESITWSAVSAGLPSFRHSKPGSIGGSGGFSIFSNSTRYEYRYLLGLLNSKITSYCIDVLNPTINIQAGDVQRIPIISTDNALVIKDVEQNVKMSEDDWNAFEKSEFFCKSILIRNIADHKQPPPQNY